MKDFLGIHSVSGLEVLDSRGNPTVQVEVVTEGGFSGTSLVPSGASTGSFEAYELRDNDLARFGGKGVLEAVDNVNKLSKKLSGMNIYEQRKIDHLLIDIDGTANKSNLGANCTLGISLAVCRAAANSLGIPLYSYIGGIIGNSLPIPMMNILNGGKHSDNNLSIQEFMIVPLSGENFSRRLEIGAEVYHSLKSVLKSKNLSVSVGDEGGFAPNISSNEEALSLIVDSIRKAGYIPATDVSIALDVAATEMFDEAKKEKKDGYLFWKTGEFKSTTEMLDYLEKLCNDYPIISIEDGLAEDDWDSWKLLTRKLGDKVQLVGDDLFVTNMNRLRKGIHINVANSILIKPNQIGTLTETLDVVDFAKSNGYTTIISHRSGETEDTTIADIAVATNSKYIKSGAPCRTERVSKYNRLLNIEHEINSNLNS